MEEFGEWRGHGEHWGVLIHSCRDNTDKDEC
jgi:hypothetical protein